MSAQLLDGKRFALLWQSELKTQVAALKTQRGITPGLAVVLVGEDPASQIYVSHKAKACEKVGIFSNKIQTRFYS